MARDAGYTQRHLAPLRRDRRHDHRRPRRRDRRRPDQDRLGQPHRSRRQVQPAAAHRGRARRGAAATPARAPIKQLRVSRWPTPTTHLSSSSSSTAGASAPTATNNAIALARTPVYDALLARYPHAQLIASGEAVGLPAGQMGNSEVGHMNMGAGRVVYQDLTRIDKSIRDGELFESPGARRGDGPLRRRTRTRCTSSASSRTAASTAISGTCTR